jgi:hypothetical protein
VILSTMVDRRMKKRKRISTRVKKVLVLMLFSVLSRTRDEEIGNYTTIQTLKI